MVSGRGKRGMEKGEEDFVNQVVNLLSLRAGKVAGLLVHSENGLEILSNTNDVVHKSGMLETGVDVLREVRQLTDEEMRRAVREAQQRAEDVVELISNGKGKVN